MLKYKPQKDRDADLRRAQIMFGMIVVAVAAIVAFTVMKDEPDASNVVATVDRGASPDGSGWYRDTGLTNAQVIKITEHCRDNPKAFDCQ